MSLLSVSSGHKKRGSLNGPLSMFSSLCFCNCSVIPDAAGYKIRKALGVRNTNGYIYYNTSAFGEIQIISWKCH